MSREHADAVTPSMTRKRDQRVPINSKHATHLFVSVLISSLTSHFFFYEIISYELNKFDRDIQLNAKKNFEKMIKYFQIVLLFTFIFY